MRFFRKSDNLRNMNSDVIQIIQSAKLSITPLRKMIIEEMLNINSPTTAIDLMKRINSLGLKPNKTSLYRQLDTLIEKKIIQKVSLESHIDHFEVRKSHHHHLVCQECDKIECLESSNLEKAIHDLEDDLSKKGMQILEHRFSLKGICKQCVTH